MIFEIIRKVHYPFGDCDEEQWGEPVEFANITEAVNFLKEAKGLINNTYEFGDIDRENNMAGFIITNRSRYEGDFFTIRPLISHNGQDEIH
jgi:hypothetical protein